MRSNKEGCRPYRWVQRHRFLIHEEQKKQGKRDVSAGELEESKGLDIVYSLCAHRQWCRVCRDDMLCDSLFGGLPRENTGRRIMKRPRYRLPCYLIFFLLLVPLSVRYRGGRVAPGGYIRESDAGRRHEIQSLDLSLSLSIHPRPSFR